MNRSQSDFAKIIGKMLELPLQDIENQDKFEPTLTDRFNEDQTIEEDDSEETFSVMIKDKHDLNERIIDINTSSTKRPVIAIDSSSITLGKTQNGIIAAIKAAVVLDDHVEIFGPFIHHITNDNKNKIYNYFMNEIFDLPMAKNIPILSKMPDRIRNFMERLVQRYASTKVKNAIILWDGALGAGKSQFDTPEELMESSLSMTKENGNSVVAITKKTNLILSSNESIFSVLSEQDGPAIVDLTNKIEVFGSKIYKILGTTFAAKLTFHGIPFRIDVSTTNKSTTPSSILSDLLRSTTFHHGYPVELRNAHIYSKITKDEVLACQKMVATKYHLPIVNVPDMHKVLLSPFG